MPLLEDLLRPRSKEEILSLLISILQAKGYPATDWEPGSVQRTILEAVAEAGADLERLRVEIAKGGFLELASGGWLDLVARNMYGLERKPALFAVHKAVLSAEPGFGPYQIAPGQIWAATPGGLRFNNITGGDLPRGGSLEIELKAESPGAAYNAPPGTITVLLTPLPGVSISNTEILQAGTDAETDEALRFRCRLRWATLGTGATADAYRHWALTADPRVTKVRVFDQHPRGQGTVDVVIWGEGGLGQEVVERVDAYIQERKPLTADVLVEEATAVSVPIGATITLRAGFLEATQAEVEERLIAMQRALPIGGTIYRSALIEALFGRHVINVELSTPAQDLFLGDREVAILSPNLTYREVRSA